MLTNPTPPQRPQGVTPEDHRIAIAAWRLTDDGKPTWGITHWDEDKLGPQPTMEEVLAYEPPPPTPVPAPAPQSIAAWRAKAILRIGGYLELVEAAIDALPEPPRALALDAWNGNAEISISSPTIALLAAALQWDESQAQDFFRQAAALSV